MDNIKLKDHELYNLFEYNKNGRIVGMNYYPTLGELYTYQGVLMNEHLNYRSNRVMSYNSNVLKRIIHYLVWKVSIHPEKDFEIRNIILRCKDKRYREKHGGKLQRNL